MKKNKIPLEDDSLCFSFITENRTLDLKAIDASVRGIWTNYFK